MEFMNKYFSRKNLFYVSIVTAVLALLTVLLLGTLHIDELSQLKSGLSTLLIGTYLYEVCFIGNIVLVTGYAFLYYGKKDKNQATLIMFAAGAVALILQLFTLNMVVNLQRVILAISSGNIMKLAGFSESSFNGADTKKLLMIISMLINTAMGAYLGYLKYGKKTTFEANKNEDINNKAELNEIKQESQEHMESAKQKTSAFLSSKKGKYTILAVAAVIVLVGIFIIINNNRKTDFDVTKDCELVFSGDSKEGIASVENCKLDYDLNDEDMEKFVASLDYDIKGNGSLKNGDEVTAVAVYSEETAKSLKLNIINPTIVKKVEGLREIYASLDEIPDDILKDADTRINDYVKNEVEGDLHFSDLDDDKGITIDSRKILGKYFVKEVGWSEEDAIIYLYKVTAKGQKRKSWLSDEYEPGTEDKYFYVLYREVSSNAEYDAEVTKDSYYTFGNASDKGMINDFKEKYPKYEEIK